MKPVDRRTFLKTVPAVAAVGSIRQFPTPAAPFGQDFPQLDWQTTGDWWTARTPIVVAPAKKPVPPIVDLDVRRDEVVVFAMYTHENGVLKMTAQLFPLLPDEPREARLEIQRNGAWEEVARAPVVYPGWSAHFRVEKWDNARTVAYRVRHGASAMFPGTIRRDPIDRDEIVVGNLSCNSSRTPGGRPEIVNRLVTQDPDVLFFAGDQTYHHTEHTAGFIEFGLQFRDAIRDRPTICIPDDHDVGHGNLWGEAGGTAKLPGAADGGYLYPPAYVNMVQRVQSWHLPDPVDPAPVRQGITVYFTRLRVGGIDFAILEDRKFKTGPAGAIPQLGPRPDHINDERYDPAAIDLPDLQLLGERQMAFLRRWTADWTGAEMKCVLSQTAFCGAVHLHGTPDNRLLADLDCGGWPQSRRNEALREIRRARAVHLCGDQHLAVALKHGMDAHRDGPYGFTSPALVNTVYARWWHPRDEQPGANPVPNSPLPWTGDYRDGLGNRVTILAYANPGDLTDERQRADGYGLARFNKEARTVTFECWPRFSDGRQFPGWPITVRSDDNDGRQPIAWLPELLVEGVERPVVQVTDAGGDILYTTRLRSSRFQPPVYAAGTYTVRAGRDRPDGSTLTGVRAAPTPAAAGTITVRL
jgi:hypothetical protein